MFVLLNAFSCIKHFELPPCMKGALQIILPYLAMLRASCSLKYENENLRFLTSVDFVTSRHLNSPLIWNAQRIMLFM